MRKKVFSQFLQKKLKYYLYPQKTHYYGRRKPAQTVNVTDKDILNLENDLGISVEYFEELFSNIREYLTRTIHTETRRLRVMTPKKRLWLVLYWLRNYPPYKLLGDLLGISASSISRDIHFILPILSDKMENLILWPEDFQIQLLPCALGAIGAVDCAAFKRFRPHPSQSFFFNGHKEFCLF